MSAILEMRGITKAFSGVKALDDVSLSVERGSVHAICGENGAGKSTLMKVLSGVYTTGTFDGEIIVDGEQQHFRTINDSERQGIVIIHQELALSPFLSIAENIFIGNERARRGVIDWHRTNREAAALLERVGLHESVATPVSQLGVGKQQLVEIAKALAKDVRLLILDEPTAALNDDDSEHLLGLIRLLKDEGITCIIISHKLKEIRAIADRVTVIRDGATIETLEGDEIVESRIIRAMVGRDLDSMFPERTPSIGEERLRVEHWTAHHPLDGSRVVVDDVSFTVRAGEIVGFAGLMGAGRTELAMSIFGHSYGQRISGTVFVDGKEVSTRTVQGAIDAGIAYVTEDRKHYGLNLIGDITENTTAAALDKVSRASVIDVNREVQVAEQFRASMRTRAMSVSAIVGGLSGGNQQKVVLSKWIFSDPDVLILDEPTRGIDVGAKLEIYGIIDRLAEAGKAIVVISSELPELLGIADRIYTISAGRITGEISREDATPELLMQHMTQERQA